MGEPARIRLKVRHYEVDDYGHVNHANYVHYLEVARVEALEVLGLSLAEMRRQGYIIVAAGLSVTFHSPAHSGETLEILTQIQELRGARSIWVQEIREAQSHRLVVTAEVTGAFMTEAGRPVRPPRSFREKLATLHVAGVPPPAEGEADATRAIAPLDAPSQDASGSKARWWCFCRGRGLASYVA